MQHLDEGTIHAWLDGALPADEAAAVERHANECAVCAALVADARGLIAGAARIISALDDVPRGVIPKQPTPAAPRSLWRNLRLTPFRAALAASLLVAAGSLAVIQHAPREQSPKAATVEKLVLPPAASAVASPSAPPVSNTAVGEKRLRVRDEAPPTARVAAAPPPRGEAKPVVAAESPKIIAVDSIRRAPPVAAGAGASPAAEPVARSKAPAETAKLESAIASARAQTVVAGALGRDTRRDAALRNAADVQAPPFSLVLASADDRPLSPPGCYQLVRDSTDASVPMPDRFVLEYARDTAQQSNVMRALTLDGRKDSVLAGVTWRLAPGAPSVVVVRRDGPVGQALQQRAMSSPMRAAPGFATAKPIRLSRIDCR